MLITFSITMQFKGIIVLAASIALAKAFQFEGKVEDGIYIIEKDASGNEFATNIGSLNTTPTAEVPTKREVFSAKIVSRDTWGVSWPSPSIDILHANFISAPAVPSTMLTPTMP